MCLIEQLSHSSQSFTSAANVSRFNYDTGLFLLSPAFFPVPLYLIPAFPAFFQLALPPVKTPLILITRLER